MITTMPAGVRLVLASFVAIGMGAALLLPGAGRPLLVGLPPAAPPPAAPAVDDPARAAILAELTADDVARGVWALAATTDGPALTAEQRARLAPEVATASQLRADLGERRTAQRTAERALLTDGVSLAEALGPARLARLPHAGATGTPPPPRTPDPSTSP